MARWAPLRADVIDELGTEVLDAFPRGRILIGVDGFDDERTTAFGRDLAAAIRHAGVDAAALAFSAYRAGHGYDVAAFRTGVLGPYRNGDAIDVVDPALAAGDRSVLVVSGRYLLAPDLVGIWHSSIWLNSPLDETAPKGGADWDEGKRYLHDVDPKRRANADVDATDAEHPRRTFADSC